MAGPSLGINLGSVVDWTTSYPFLDLFKTSRDWFTGYTPETDFADGLDLDAHGWVRGLTRDGSAAPFTDVQTIMATAEIGPRPGTYIMDWVGEADITIYHGARIIESGDHRMVLALEEGVPFAFGLSNIDPDDYARDIRIYHQDDADLIAAGQVFTPEFLERIDDFRVLRFMDWARTNNSDVSRPGDMTVFDPARESLDSGVSLATMVDLANTVRADPWFCIPHEATDATIRAIARYVRDHLDPGLVARFEYSNEVWNWGFEQAQWAGAQAEATWGADVQGGWMQWYGVRAANMANIVADVFGDETGSRALNVFSTQSAWLGLEGYALDAADHVAGRRHAMRRSIAMPSRPISAAKSAAAAIPPRWINGLRWGPRVWMPRLIFCAMATRRIRWPISAPRLPITRAWPRGSAGSWRPMRRGSTSSIRTACSAVGRTRPRRSSSSIWSASRSSFKSTSITLMSGATMAAG
jgi:hypothetical protein